MPRVKMTTLLDELEAEASPAQVSTDAGELVAKYLRWRRNAKQRDRHTIGEDRRWLGAWCALLAVPGHTLLEATEEDAMEMMRRLDDRDWSASTRAKAVGVIRQFYDWLVDDGALGSNPWRRIEQPKREAPIRMPLTVEEFERVCGQMSRLAPSMLCHRALLELLYSSGCRIGEALGLNVGDVDLGQGRAVAFGKGKRYRVLYLTPRAVEHVRRWMKHGRPLVVTPKSTGAVFVGKQGKRLCEGVFNEALQTAARRAGITKRVFPHLLRHSIASELLERGVDLRHIQTFLGHKQISTTILYTRVNPERIEQIHRDMHPLQEVRR